MQQWASLIHAKIDVFLSQVCWFLSVDGIVWNPPGRRSCSQDATCEEKEESSPLEQCINATFILYPLSRMLFPEQKNVNINLYKSNTCSQFHSEKGLAMTYNPRLYILRPQRIASGAICGTHLTFSPVYLACPSDWKALWNLHRTCRRLTLSVGPCHLFIMVPFVDALFRVFG